MKLTAKQRYDVKRRNTYQRNVKEAERYITRILTKRGLLMKTGSCSQCAITGKTVWHHQTYQGVESLTIELCYRCHRHEHPRAMPHGGIK